MQLSIGLDGTDVMAVVQAQPSLLVQESSTNDIQVRPEPLPLLKFPKPAGFVRALSDYQGGMTQWPSKQRRERANGVFYLHHGTSKL